MTHSSSTKPIEFFPGATALERYGAMDFLIQYLQARGLLKPDAVPALGAKELHYKSDEQLWNDTINNRLFFESRRLFLEEFALLNWVPRVPGLYHTPEGAEARRRAEHCIIERSHGFVVFDPSGKAQMVRGGVGCLRLAMKYVGGEQLQFLCATKSGVAHRGFLVAMRPHTYSKVAELVETAGAAICNIVGEIRYWPTDISLPFYSSVNIPRIYLLVEDVTVVGSRTIRPGSLDVTAAVTFQGVVEGRKGRYFTYAHFDPALRESINECVSWIRINYVEGRYRGKVLTDFDEHIAHFPDAVFPVKILMDPDISPTLISRICDDCFPMGPSDRWGLAIYIDKLQVGGSIVSNITITGDGNVVGSNNLVVTKINKRLMRSDLRELGEAFALLRGEILQLDSAPQKVKNHAVRAIQDVEEEAADENPSPGIIDEGLRRAKEVLENAGESYDRARSWGKRLYDLGNVLMQVIPTVSTWVASLLC